MQQNVPAVGAEVRVRPFDVRKSRPVYTGTVEHVHAFADGASVVVRRADGVTATAHVYHDTPQVSDLVDVLDLVGGFLLVDRVDELEQLDLTALAEEAS